MQKVVRDGKVAVLVSPDFGAGWSTWADSSQRETMMFDSRLISAAENNVSDIETVLLEIFGENFPYPGGWSDIKIVWIPEGTTFWIKEYDGAESIVYEDEIKVYVA